MTPEIINSLGFDFENAFDVKGRLSISDFFPESKKRCGIYLLEFTDSTFYIGQAIDVVRRFTQHRKKHTNIQRFWFQSVIREQLNEKEQQIIQDAELRSLLLTNKTYVSNIIGDTDLDLIISPLEQEYWFDNNHSADEFDLYSAVESKHIVKYKQNFESVKLLKSYPQYKRILNTYIKECLPVYTKSELSFWSLSCMPSTNNATFPRHFCMNINSMEVFVAGEERKNNTPFAFFILTNAFAEEENVFERLYMKYPTLVAEISNYRAAGTDQVCFHFSNLDEVEDILIKEPNIIKSIKELNLRLMRKGGTIYSPYHCFNLVKDVLQ